MTGFSPAICLVFYPQPHPLFFLLSEPPASVAKRGPVLTPVSSLEAFQFPFGTKLGKSAAEYVLQRLRLTLFFVRRRWLVGAVLPLFV